MESVQQIIENFITKVTNLNLSNGVAEGLAELEEEVNTFKRSIVRKKLQELNEKSFHNKNK